VEDTHRKWESQNKFGRS